MALKSDGTVWAWGSDINGPLGDGTTSDRHQPVRVTRVIHATAIAAGGDHSLALLQDGTVRAWGHNSVGQLGDGTITGRHSPVQTVLP